jgi:hypothetical protein
MRARRITTLLGVLLCVARAASAATWDRPLKVVAPDRFTVTTPAGSGVVPVYVSADWSHPLPGIRRVVIMVHGVGRNADSYFRSVLAASDAAGADPQTTLLIAPQFLADVDVAAFHLPSTMLHWDADNWQAGQPAHGPAAVPAFDVFDALLRRVVDRALLPALTTVVVAGHSAGGQVVHRYSIVGRGEGALLSHGVHVRYVVANPSSYLYLSAERPERVDAATCPEFNRWRYGLLDPPPYVGSTAGLDAPFAARDVIYLLGTADVDPHQSDLATNCAAEAEGAYRLVRGTNYFAYLKTRYRDGFAHRLALVPGVAHQGRRMFTSACGLAALFDHPGCPGL